MKRVQCPTPHIKGHSGDEAFHATVALKLTIKLIKTRRYTKNNHKTNKLATYKHKKVKYQAFPHIPLTYCSVYLKDGIMSKLHKIRSSHKLNRNMTITVSIFTALSARHTVHDCCWHIPGKTVESRQDVVWPCWQQWPQPRGLHSAYSNISSAKLACHQLSRPGWQYLHCHLLHITVQDKWEITETHNIK